MAKKKSSFRGKTNKDAQRQQNAASSYGYLLLPQGVDVFSAEPGSKNVKLDILPYKVSDIKHIDRDSEDEIAMPGTLWYKHPFYIHRSVGSDNETIVCLKSIGKKCPICEYRKKRASEGAEKEETDSMKNSLRNLYVVLPIGSRKYEEKPHIFDISQFNFQKLLNEELADNPDYGVFPDLEEGYTLKVRFASKTVGAGQPYAAADRIDFIEREEAYDEAILEDVPDLDKVLKILSYEELQAMFFELDDEEIGGSLKEEDDDDEEEEEEEEKPIRQRVKKSKKPVVEDEEDEDEEDEDEEEEKPSKKPARSKSAAAKKGASNKCPYGHKFGVDTEKYDDCEECDIWEDCLDEKEKNE